MRDAAREIEVSRCDYNEGRPQEAVGNRTPKDFMPKTPLNSGMESICSHIFLYVDEFIHLYYWK